MLCAGLSMNQTPAVAGVWFILGYNELFKQNNTVLNVKKTQQRNQADCEHSVVTEGVSHCSVCLRTHGRNCGRCSQWNRVCDNDCVIERTMGCDKQRLTGGRSSRLEGFCRQNTLKISSELASKVCGSFLRDCVVLPRIFSAMHL